MYENIIDLLNCQPKDEDVIALFRGQLSVNDVRRRLGLAPDANERCDSRTLLDPDAYTMELGEALAETIFRRMVNSESQIERDFVHRCRERQDFLLSTYCGR